MRIKFLKLLITVGFITNCASHKKINKLASNLDCDKPIEFIYDERSNLVKIEKIGSSIGESNVPDYELALEDAVNELQKSMNTKLTVTKTRGFPSNSILKVIVTIEKIEWNFRTADAIMNTDLKFKLEGREIKTTGTNVVYVHGTKKGNLRKSLKSGIYQFLNIYCYQ